LTHWKRGIAAAAATILVFCGSYGLATYAGLTTGTQVVDNGQTQVAEIPNNNGAIAPVGELGSDAEMTPANNNNPNNQGETGVESPPKGTPVETTDNNGKKPAVQETSEPTASVEKNPELVALLSVDKQRLIQSTLIKTRVEEPEAAGKQVNSLAGQYQAGIRVVESQNTAGGSLLAYELTVDRNKTEQLVGGLEKLGVLTVKDESSKDISDQYNKQVEQYQSLDAQLKNSANAGEQEQLNLQMNEIAQQLKAWESEIGKHKIVIWLEN